MYILVNFSGAFRLYDVDNDGFITRDEMYNIVDAIYQMVVSQSIAKSKLLHNSEIIYRAYMFILII